MRLLTRTFWRLFCVAIPHPAPVHALTPGHFLWTQEHFDFLSVLCGLALLPVFIRRTDKVLEQGVRFERLRLEFRVELAPDKVGVIRQLDHLDIGSVGWRPGDAHSGRS